MELLDLLNSNQALIVAGFGLMVILVRALGVQVQNNLKLSTAMITQSDTMIRLNNELQEQSKERQAWQLERVRLDAELNNIKRERTNDIERGERQFTGMQTQIAQIRTQRDRLQGELEAIARKVGDLDKENKELRDKVIALERENTKLRGERTVLIEKVDNLMRRLEAEIESNTDLRCELDKLRERVTELPSTDDLTKAAAKVTPPIGFESSEGTTPIPETKPESSNEET